MRCRCCGVDAVLSWEYDASMIQIRFPSIEQKRSALSALAGRFAFKSWATGEMLVPEDALPFLAVQGIAFAVEGPNAGCSQSDRPR